MGVYVCVIVCGMSVCCYVFVYVFLCLSARVSVFVWFFYTCMCVCLCFLTVGVSPVSRVDVFLHPEPKTRADLLRCESLKCPGGCSIKVVYSSSSYVTKVTNLYLGTRLLRVRLKVELN